MLLADLLGLVLDGRAPHQRVFQLADDRPVQPVAKVLDGVLFVAQHDGRLVVRQLALGLRVDAHEVEVLPHLLEQVVEVPLVVGGDRDTVRHLVDNVQLLDGDLVDLVEHVDGGDVHAVALDDVDQLVLRRVIAQHNVRVVDAILAEDGLDRVEVQVRRRDHRRQVDAALLLAAERDVWRLPVQPDAEALELTLDDLLVPERLQDIKADEDQIARTRNCNDLATTTLAILGTLNDSRKVEQLDLGTLVVDDTGHGRQCRELVRCDLGVHAGQVRQERGLADGWEADEANAGVTRLRDVEAFAGWAATALGGNELTAELGKLGLELAKMEARGLVLLRAGHLGLDILDFLKDRHLCCASRWPLPDGMQSILGTHPPHLSREKAAKNVVKGYLHGSPGHERARALVCARLSRAQGSAGGLRCSLRQSDRCAHGHWREGGAYRQDEAAGLPARPQAQHRRLPRGRRRARYAGHRCRSCCQEELGGSVVGEPRCHLPEGG
eukprot:m.222272 g.222272  ORF g.222272 m.222272 type:complete len:496 (+) comp10733_c0_seq1:131-1618(+)